MTSVLLYGAHCWALSAVQLERLEVVQRDHLRRILGKAASQQPAPGGTATRTISNERLYEICSQPTIEQQLRSTCGRWVGHVLRMPDYRLAKQLFFWQAAHICTPAGLGPQVAHVSLPS